MPILTGKRRKAALRALEAEPLGNARHSRYFASSTALQQTMNCDAAVFGWNSARRMTRSYCSSMGIPMPTLSAGNFALHATSGSPQDSMNDDDPLESHALDSTSPPKRRRSVSKTKTTKEKANKKTKATTKTKDTPTRMAATRRRTSPRGTSTVAPLSTPPEEREETPSIPVPVTPEPANRTTEKVKDEETIPLTPQKVIISPEKKETPSTKSKPRKKSPKTKKKITHNPPSDWQSVYELVEELRADRTAPVDTDGSEALPERNLGDATYRFQVLIALMLSSQTKDAVVGETMRKLQKHGLTLENIRVNTDYETLNGLIGKVGFHNTKAKNILKVADILHEEYKGDIPPTAQEMIDGLPGVGPKMAFIVENVAFGKQTGIGVDTHMHRIFNQLKWVQSKQPEQTRVQLESWLPKQYWPSVNLLWVGFGQEVQQFPEKMLRKALDSSKPQDALSLVQKLGLDVRKVGKKAGMMDEIDAIFKSR